MWQSKVYSVSSLGLLNHNNLICSSDRVAYSKLTFQEIFKSSNLSNVVSVLLVGTQVWYLVMKSPSECGELFKKEGSSETGLTSLGNVYVKAELGSS